MKVSKCKKELARIISEHGGWRNGEFAAQDGDGGVGGYGSKPEWNSLVKYWWREALGGWFLANKIKNHHQTVLSRAEYFHLYPEPDADGWTEWNGLVCPIEGSELVEVRLRNPPAGNIERIRRADEFDWMSGFGDDGEIIAYRLHKPEQVETVEYNCLGVVHTGPVKSEFVVDEKLTLDQLLQDWRNADDFAKRKQAEADEAAAMRDERRQAVQDRAGEFNVTVGWCDGMVDESELVITDWRNLLVGDIVEIVGSENERWLRFKGVELFVSRTGASEYDLVFRSHDGDEWGHGGNTNWRFIRRP